MADTEPAPTSALVIDPNPTSRSVLCAQLRDLGMTSVLQCGRVVDARRQLETRSFDVVLCEMDFPGSGTSGRELLEDLRRQQILPLTTVFVMVTGEASYARVAEAAEAALDSYLLKPCSATALAERLRQAHARKRSLSAIFTAIGEDRFEDAAGLCLQRFQERGPYWTYAARIGGELMLRLRRHAQAQQMFEAIAQTQALPWARLGIARAQLEGGEGPPALRTLESLIADQPTFADAYDVMGRVQLEQGRFDEALTIYRRAAELTPGSLGRLQKLGMLAFYAGDCEEAVRALDRAAIIGQKSRQLDFQSIMLLAFGRFRLGDSKGLQRSVLDLQRALENAPGSGRLQRFVAVAGVLQLMQQKQLAEVVAQIKQLAGTVTQPSFDVEAACNLLCLMAELVAAELTLPDADDWIDRLARRFCTTKGITELLLRTAHRHPPFAQRVQSCHAEIGTLTASAMMHTVEGQPSRAVQTLLAHAERTLNMKFVELASGVLQRYDAKISDGEALHARLAAIQQRLGQAPRLPPLGSATGRPEGGLSFGGKI